MKISFENKKVACYKEIFHQIKYIQESTESVVPDTNDDIGKIASVQSSIHLKSKDVTGRGVLVSGEALAAVIYITENEKNVSFVKLSRQFTMEFDVPNLDTEVLPQIKLDIQSTEARIINPRKLSLSFEICGELSCYKASEIPVESIVNAEVTGKIHSKFNTASIMCTNSVCEKTFTLTEQLVFPGGKPAPSQIAKLNVSFNLNESQNVGSKLIIKGNMNICVCYLSDEVNYPVKAEFSSPFSQIIDVGVDNVESYTTSAQLSSVYYDIINTISGEKALDVEIHAVLQINTREKREIKYIADAYSNIMPAACVLSSQNLTGLATTQQMKIIADERISVVDDCMDVLSVFTSISHLNVQPDKISTLINFDIIYRTREANLSSARRSVSLSGDCTAPPERLISAQLTDVYLRPDGAYIDVHAAVDLKYQCLKNVDIAFVSAVELDEENALDFSAFPALYLVRADTEDLWTLAKNYHSSVERINASNSIDDGIIGKVLLIPKSI